MIEADKKSNIVIPLCIFHYDDEITNTYRGFIGNPSKIKTKDGYEILKCMDTDPSYGRWKLYGSFYALSPMIRPIPRGLKLMNANKLNYAPYNTSKVKYAYDPFDTQSESVSFLTWSKAVRDTVPLYLHITPEGGTYPSFDPNPPGKKGWTKDIISPLYVLVDKKMYIGSDANKQVLSNYDRDEYGKPEFKFSPENGRCLPDPYGMSLAKCFLITDENVLAGGAATYNTNLLDQLREDKKLHKQKNIREFFRTLPNAVIIICNILFFTSLFICILILLKE